MLYDNIIVRIIIDLHPEQVTALAELCKSEKISRAEAVRRALDEMLVRKQLRGREEAFGKWPRSGDSRNWVENLRKEWDR